MRGFRHEHLGAEPLLKTPLGLTLVYSVSRRNGVIGLPEVVELELKKKIVEAGLECAAKAKSHLHMLRTLTGNLGLSNELPNGDLLAQKVDERISQLSSILIRQPFTLEHAKAALAMVNAKFPPNDKNQQFKYSAIWQAVLSFAQNYTTSLLTLDKAYFNDRDSSKGLAKNLIQEGPPSGGEITGFDGIGPYLKALSKGEPEFERSQLLNLILEEAKPRLKQESERMQIGPVALTESSISAFPTSNPDQLAIDYTLTFKLDSVPPASWLKGEAQGFVHGSAYFFPSEGALAENYIQRIAVKTPGSFSARSFQDYEGNFAFPRPIPDDYW